MGSRRVGHNWATSLSLFTFMHWRRKWQPTPVLLPGESQGREPGGLSSMGSHRVGHDWSDLAAVAAAVVSSWFSSLLSHYIKGISNLITWRKQWQPTPVLLLGKSHGRKSLVGCSPWGHKESDMTEQLHFHFSLSCIGEGNGNPLQQQQCVYDNHKLLIYPSLPTFPISHHVCFLSASLFSVL